MSSGSGGVLVLRRVAGAAAALASSGSDILYLDEQRERQRRSAALGKEGRDDDGQDKLAAAKERSPQLYDDLYWKKAYEQDDKAIKWLLLTGNFFGFSIGLYVLSYLHKA
ncbi:uncharacterized protein LOC127779701 isoform X1 [Oryza glaberrima]|uniref:uncharacterized protein LOC127779701 isoform X1 n=1 Tax=Oryza glaberrima TaxID=4538 RepID=UPI00224C4B6B|nr:uncharacterized protein LOC127779701 isoform X1 [Oryza glaberrima]